MGIAGLWLILRQYDLTQVPFPQFVAHFIDSHGRPPRIAIDAYALILQTIVPDDSEALIERVFMAKLHNLISLNVSFVVVFDGRWKPDKLRHSRTAQSTSRDPSPTRSRSPSRPSSRAPSRPPSRLSRSPSRSPTRSGPSYEIGDHSMPLHENSPLIARIQSRLLADSIDYIQAPAEAEAQCAFLQRAGIVDYVLSEDSDALVFGATKMIKNFHKPSQNQPYHVTPVHIDQIMAHTGLDSTRLALVACLSGGDYSTGSSRIGIALAVNIAQSGTKFGINQDQNAPDFGAQFLECFDRSHHPPFNSRARLRAPDDRHTRLVHFVLSLNEVLKNRPKDIFKDNRKLPPVDIDESIALLYFFPLVTKDWFIFVGGHVSFGEKLVVEPALAPCPWAKAIRVDRTNALLDAPVGALYLSVAPQFTPTQELPAVLSLAIFDTETANVKNIVVKLLTHQNYRKHISITSEKLENGTRYFMLKYPKNLSGIIYSGERPHVDVDRFWAPGSVISYVNQEIIDKFDRDYELQMSPKKTQKTTLDSFGKFPASPKKRNPVSPTTSPTKRRLLKSKDSPKKQKVSPRKLMARKGETSPKKHDPPSGQSLLSSFLGKKESKDPFMSKDPPAGLFKNAPDQDYSKLHTSFKRAPMLGNPPTLEHTNSIPLRHEVIEVISLSADERDDTHDALDDILQFSDLSD